MTESVGSNFILAERGGIYNSVKVLLSRLYPNRFNVPGV
jgi:hypothetical protein